MGNRAIVEFLLSKGARLDLFCAAMLGQLDVVKAALTATPALNQFGTATITVTVNDGTTTTNATFVLTVTAVNDVPTISAIADTTTAEDMATSALAFTVTTSKPIQIPHGYWSVRLVIAWRPSTMRAR